MEFGMHSIEMKTLLTQAEEILTAMHDLTEKSYESYMRSEDFDVYRFKADYEFYQNREIAAAALVDGLKDAIQAVEDLEDNGVI